MDRFQVVALHLVHDLEPFGLNTGTLMWPDVALRKGKNGHLQHARLTPKSRQEIVDLPLSSTSCSVKLADRSVMDASGAAVGDEKLG